MTSPDAKENESLMNRYAFLFTIALSLISVAVAYCDEDENANKCNEAWLSHQWATVAVRCDAAAEDYNETAGKYIEVKVAINEGEIRAADEFDANATAPPDDSSNTRNTLLSEKDLMTWNNMLAGRSFARAAYGYAKLHRADRANAELSQANFFLSRAAETADADDMVEINKLKMTINARKFYARSADGLLEDETKTSSK